MDIGRKIARWERQLEKAPKIILLRTLLLYFCLSVVAGFGISAGIRVQQARAREKQVQSIREEEKKRMDERLQKLKLSSYESGSGK